MPKLSLAILLFAASFLTTIIQAADPLQPATNQLQNPSTNQPATNQPVLQSPNDPELQQAAQQVFRKIIIFGVIALIGALAVIAFALYGAYRKFGIPGVAVVIVIVTIGLFLFGNLLLAF